MDTTHTPPTENPRLLAIKRMFHMPTAPALLLVALLDGEVITQHVMVENGIAPSDVTARSVVSRLRKYLEAREIQIESQYGTGYWLNKDQLQKVLALLPEGVS